MITKEMKRNLSILISCLFLLSGCSEFIEPSLGGKTVHLLAPGDELESTTYKQLFWWERHEDALRYRIQIVSPKFDSVATFIMDSVVTTDKFEYTLDPGKYEWRVRPENGSSSGVYTTRSFTIFPSSIGDQQVQLNIPGTGFITGTTDIQFGWLSLFGATKYRLQIDKNNFADENKLTFNVVTSNLSSVQTMTTEGLYQWRVRAETATLNSKWSVVRTFTYDVTPPDKVVLSSPINEQSVTKPVALRWNAPADATKYELEVYNNNATTPINGTFPLTLTSTSYSLTAGEIGEKLMWRVRAIDKSGNKGAYSDYFTFTIQ